MTTTKKNRSRARALPEWPGWSIDEEGLWCPDWRGPLGLHEIRALPWVQARCRDLDRQLRELRAHVDALEGARAAAEADAARLRRLVHAEARFGLMFSAPALPPAEPSAG